MNSKTSSFCTLTLAEDLYIQAAGSKTRMMIEIRKPLDYNGFGHSVIGKKSLFKIKTKVPYSGGVIQVKSNEIFNHKQAKEIFNIFIHSFDVTTRYIKRDITEMFIK